MVTIKQFLVVISLVVKIKQFLVVISPAVKIKQLLVVSVLFTLKPKKMPFFMFMW